MVAIRAPRSVVCDERLNDSRALVRPLAGECFRHSSRRTLAAGGLPFGPLAKVPLLGALFVTIAQDPLHADGNGGERFMVFFGSACQRKTHGAVDGDRRRGLGFAGIWTLSR